MFVRIQGFLLIALAIQYNFGVCMITNRSVNARTLGTFALLLVLVQPQRVGQKVPEVLNSSIVQWIRKGVKHP